MLKLSSPNSKVSRRVDGSKKSELYPNISIALLYLLKMNYPIGALYVLDVLIDPGAIERRFGYDDLFDWSFYFI